MTITKQNILSGNLEALRTLVVTIYTKADAEVDADVGEIDQKSCKQVAEAIGSGKVRLEWQEKSTELLLLNIQESVPDLSTATLAYIHFCHDVLQPFSKLVQLDDALVSHQDAIRQKVFHQSLRDIYFWLKPHPLKNIVDFLYLTMLGWQDGFGQHSEGFLHSYLDVVETIQASVSDNATDFIQLEKLVKQAFTEQLIFLDKFAQRMKSTEVGKIKNRVAQHTALHFLNRLLENKQVPKPIANFLQDTLLNELFLFLTQHGISNQAWTELQTLLNALVTMYQAGQFTETHKSLPAQLQQFFDKHLHTSEASNDFLNNISFDISQLAAGNAIDDCIHVAALPFPEHLHDVEKNVSQQLLANIKQCKENQWFLLRDEQSQWQRCKLLTKLDEYNQLLFSNFVGQKALVASFEDFAYLLSAKHLLPLSNYGVLTRCFHGKLDTLIDGFEQRYQQRQQDILAIKQARQKAEEEHLRQLAAEKARAEAQAIAKRRAELAQQAEQERKAEEARLNAIKQQEQQAQLEADLRRQARLTLDSLTLGSWVEIKDDAGMYKKAKLAVKFAATGRFIFVDDNGITLLEAQRDELVGLMLAGTMRYLDSDKKFAERLAKVVSDIRELK